MALLFAAFLLAADPDPPQKTAPTTETQSSALTAALTELQNTRTKLQEQRDDSFWSVLKAVLASSGISVVAIGGAAKWWASTRIERIKIEHGNDMERMKEEHKQAVDLARLNAETKKEANDGDLDKLRKDFEALEKRCLQEERRCQESLAKLSERLAKEEAKSDALQARLLEYKEQLLVLQATGRQSAFASWTVDFNKKVVDTTPACERQILIPLGKTRDSVERKPAAEIWPPQLAKLVEFLDSEAAVRPSHIAGALNVLVDSRLPPMAVVKVLATDQYGRAYGIQGVAIPMSCFVDVPDGLLDGSPALNAPQQPKGQA